MLYKNISLPLVVSLLLTSFSAHAQNGVTTTEIKKGEGSSKSGEHFVRVTHDGRTKFDLCDAQLTDKCLPIGRPEGYTDEQLITARKKMKAQAWFKGIAGTTVLLVGLAGGVVVGGTAGVIAGLSVQGTGTAIFVESTAVGGLIGGGGAFLLRLTPHNKLLAMHSLDQSLVHNKNKTVDLNDERTLFGFKVKRGFVRYKSVEGYASSLKMALLSVDKDFKGVTYLAPNTGTQN